MSRQHQYTITLILSNPNHLKLNRTKSNPKPLYHHPYHQPPSFPSSSYAVNSSSPSPSPSSSSALLPFFFLSLSLLPLPLPHPELGSLGNYRRIRSHPELFPDDKDLFFVLVSPEFEAPTQKMRAVLPAEIRMMARHVWNASQAGAMVASLLQEDLAGMGKALSSDNIVEPKRAPVILGMEAVRKAALEAGAFGCTISGVGPMVVATVVDGEEKGKVISERRGRGRREMERKRGRRVEEWKTIRERERKSRQRKRKRGRQWWLVVGAVVEWFWVRFGSVQFYVVWV